MFNSFSYYACKDNHFWTKWALYDKCFVSPRSGQLIRIFFIIVTEGGVNDAPCLL